MLFNIISECNGSRGVEIQGYQFIAKGGVQRAQGSRNLRKSADSTRGSATDSGE